MTAALCLILVAALQGCGAAGTLLGVALSSGSGGSSGQGSYTVGGTVTGLAGSGLVLSLLKSNLFSGVASSSLAVSANGPFTFPATSTPSSSAFDYTVSVTTQPSNPAQICTVTNGSGTILNDGSVSTVQVACGNSYSVGGTVTGLNGTGLVLVDSSGVSLSISANGSFNWPLLLASGSAYSIRVATQPMTQVCAVASGSGTVTSAAVNNIAVSCRTIFGRFVYVANTASNTVSGYAINTDTGALTPLPGSPYSAAGTSPVSLILTADNRFLYVAGAPTAPFGTLSGYSIDQNTGVLKVIPGLPITLPHGGSRLLLHSSGRFLYGVFGNPPAAGAGIYGFQISALNGSLSAIAGSPFASDTLFNGGAFDRLGGFFYLAQLLTPPVIASFRVDSTTGALLPAGTTALPTAGTPTDVATSPPGGALYVTTVGNQTGSGSATPDALLVYSLGPSTGIGIPVNGSPYSVGQQPSQALFSPNGRNLYVRNAGQTSAGQIPGTISAFGVNADLLTALPGSPYATGTTVPGPMSIDPTGHYLASPSTFSANLAVFTVNAATGALTALPASPLTPAVGTAPSAVTFDPSGRFAYLTDAVTNSISVYAINPANDTLSFAGSSPTGRSPSALGPVVLGQP